MAFNDDRVDVVVGEEEGGGKADDTTAYDEDGDMGFGRHDLYNFGVEYKESRR